MQEFAGKIAQARTEPRDQRRAAIAVIKRERKAALAAVMQMHGKPPTPK